MNNRNEIDEAAWQEHLNNQSREIEIEYLQEVTRESDGKEVYADSQFKLALTFLDKGKLIDAIEIWMNIKKSDSATMYARAQFDIGFCLNELGESNNAIEVWNNVERIDNPPSYARAQLNIGVILAVNSNFEAAISAWSNIKRSDNIEIYLQAQLNLGRALEKLNDIQGALKTWGDISRLENPKIYAEAQLNIGMTLYVINNLKGALSAWNNIKRKDDMDQYTSAQFNIGLASDEKKDSLIAWNNIEHTDDLRTYHKAQFNIGKSLISIDIYEHKEFKKNSLKHKDIDAAKVAFKNSELLYPYESYCYIQICKLLLDKNTRTFGRELQKFFEEVIILTKSLTLDFSGKKLTDYLPERKLAHYTSIDTINLLISNNNKDKKPSPFRLNTISNVNDPSEGQLLDRYLNQGQEETLYLTDFDEKFHTFISCFTFNHDSLNQFRLYGKKNNLEASGVSLVFKKDFFKPKSFFDGLSFLSTLEKADSLNISSTNTQELKNENINIHIKHKVDRKPVMRCIYIEPISGYIQLAQRNRLTFYKEFNVNENPEEKWKAYQIEIDNKTEEACNSLNLLRDIYKDIKKNNSVNFEKSSDLIEEIILPLKYLIKHSAFQEEQECRMIYITSLKDPKVKMDFGKFLYVEYEADVKGNLDKIYIAPAATQYQPYLAKLLCDTDVKIEISNNPYRQT